MKIREVVTDAFETVGPLESVASIEDVLLREKHLVVMEDERFIGLLTVSDTLDRPHVLVIDCLTEKPSVDVDDRVEIALEIMEERSVYFLPVFEAGHFRGAVGYKAIVESISEELAVHREKREHHEGLRMLANGVAHDFNNFVQMVLSSIEVVRYDDGISGQARKRLDDAEEALKQAQGLVEQLRLFSEKGTVSREQRKLEPFLREQASFVTSGHRVELAFDFSEELPEVSIEPERFAQVINNLLFNALDAMGDKPRRVEIGGRVVELEGEELKELSAGRYVELTIRDSGYGIEARHLRHIFEPYFTTKASGTGLGLAIVASVIDDLGGAISVESLESRGTTFTIHLPVSSSSGDGRGSE